MADTAIAITNLTPLQKYRQSEKYRIWLREYRIKNREKIYANIRRYREKPGVMEQERIKGIAYREALKSKIYAHYGSSCKCCNEATMLFLSIDHVNNDGHKDKTNGKRPGGRDLYNKIIREGYPNTYQILCMNCNHGKARNNGVCPHEGEK